MISVEQLKKLSQTRRNVFRVRRRVIWGMPPEMPWRCDTDGEEGKPLTWERWEEEYFIQQGNALRGLECDKYKDVRPRGVIDQLPAFMAWRRWLERPGVSEDANVYTELGRKVMVEPWMIEADRERPIRKPER